MEIKHGRSFLKFIRFLSQMKYGGFIFNCICDSWLSSFSFKWSGHLEFVSLTFLEAFFCTSSMFHDWQILTKVMLLWPDIFLKFQWIDWSEMTVPYLYLVVWGVTDWAFSISGSNCSHTVVLCHFPCFFAQLSPPASKPHPLKDGSMSKT